jgi:hypothetical protein
MRRPSLLPGSIPAQRHLKWRQAIKWIDHQHTKQKAQYFVQETDPLALPVSVSEPQRGRDSKFARIFIYVLTPDSGPVCSINFLAPPAVPVGPHMHPNFPAVSSWNPRPLIRTASQTMISTVRSTSTF